MMFNRFYLILTLICLLLLLINGCASEKEEYNVKVQITPEESGRVTGAGVYKKGEEVNLVATPGEGYTFENWIVNGESLEGKGEKYQFKINTDKKITAKFSKKEYKVRTGTNLGDGAIATGGGNYKYGEEAKIELKDSVDLKEIEFKKWSKNGEKVSEEKSFNFTVKKDTWLIANLELVNIEDLVLKDNIERFLLPVWENNKLGFINTRAEQVVKPNALISKETIQQEGLGPSVVSFIEITDTYPYLFLQLKIPGFAQTQKAVFNRNGELIAKMPLEKLSGYNKEGVISYRDGSYGFVDAKGRKVLDYEYDKISTIRGYSYLEIEKDRKKSLFNPVTERILDYEYDEISTIRDYDYLEIKKDRKKGIFDPVAGEVIIDIVYDEIVTSGWMEEGLFKAVDGSEEILYDKHGNKIVKLDFDETESPSKGFIAARQGDRWGFINLSWELVIEPKFEEVGEFSEGYCTVKQEDKWGLIDNNGEIIIEPKYNRLGVSFFDEGIYFFRNGTKRGYINQDGVIMVKGTYDFLHPYLYNNRLLFVFEKNEKVGLLSEEGAMVKELLFEDYSSPCKVATCNPAADYIASDYLVFEKDGLQAVFHEGELVTDFKFEKISGFGLPMEFSGVIQFIARVEGEKEKGLYDVEEGEYIIEPGEYDDVSYLSNNKIRVKQGSKYGFVDEAGSKLIDLEYDYATYFRNELAAVKKGDDVKLINQGGETVDYVEEIEEGIFMECEERIPLGFEERLLLECEERILRLDYLTCPEVYRLNYRYYFSKDHGWLKKPE